MPVICGEGAPDRAGYNINTRRSQMAGVQNSPYPAPLLQSDNPLPLYEP